MVFDRLVWDEHNLDYATRRLSAAEIEQEISNATEMFPHRVLADRRLVRSTTNGGKPVVVIVQLVRDGVRPITGWEA